MFEKYTDIFFLLSKYLHKKDDGNERWKEQKREQESEIERNYILPQAMHYLLWSLTR